MKLILILFSIISISTTIFSQNFFNPINEENINLTYANKRSIVPSKFYVTEVEYLDLISYLTNGAISESTYKSQKKTLPILIPDPDGKIQKFEVYEVKMMEDGLASRFPEIRTFKGYNSKNKLERINIGIGYSGFYATIIGKSGNYSVDRYANSQNKYYISYYFKDELNTVGRSNVCGTTAVEMLEQESKISTRSSGENLPLLTYRLALACTGEFGAFYGPTKPEVLSEMVKSVNRVNQILENDLAIRFILVNNNDKVIFLNKDNDPYNDGNTGSTLLNQNTEVLNSNLGFSNYDIGHVYTRGCDDVGGVAFIRSLCSANKGGGVTCHYVGDITTMAVRVAAHEMGHQLGSNHTFNNCGGNENTGTAYEPGSGSTIMSYGGLCGSANDVVATADDYYHVSSLIEITNYTRTAFGNNCSKTVETSNHIPEVSIPLNGGFSIPIMTPFELTGQATDEDGDQLTYSWEEFDLGPVSNLGSPQGNSPSFRSVYPSASPTRIFPKISSIITNSSNKTEVLPTYSRDLRFQFIARDNNTESGGVAWTDIKFKSNSSAGPFLVNFPNGGDVLTVGEEIEIKWDVANTNNEIINCQAVDIYLSTDRGLNFDHLLLASTFNDGIEKVFVPNIVGDKIRIKIKASKNIFFDISDQDFTIKEPTEPGFTLEFNPGYIRNCVPNDITINFNSISFLEYDLPISFEIIDGIPEGVNIEFEQDQIIPGENTKATISFLDSSVSGVFNLVLRASTTEDTLYRNIILDLLSTDFSNVKPLNPIIGTSGSIVSPIFNWTSDSDATAYYFQLSDNPSFKTNLSSILYQETLIDTFFELENILEKSTIYYWTVQGVNECGESDNSEIYTFATEALSCNTFTYNNLPQGISASAAITIEMPIEINALGKVADVNIKKLRGSHGWVSELRGELESPSGVKIVLFDKKCGNQADYNCGFDDEAISEVICPLNQGISYQPQEKLDTFNGEDISGIWKLFLIDSKIGNGGTIQEYSLELCSNAVLENPFLVRNDAMPLPSGVGRRITSDFLLTEDGNNSNNELTYTIVSLPINGFLRSNNDLLAIGSQFTQLDIDNNKIRYQHDGTGTLDSFLFTVKDGEGGWIDLTTFHIIVDNEVVLSVEEFSKTNAKLFPNPNNGHFYLTLDEIQDKLNFEVFDITGRKINFLTNQNGNNFEFNFNNLQKGIYLFKISGSKYNRIIKFIVE